MNKIKYGAAIIISDDIRAASESILSSTLFLNAPCMNRLFRFIVEKTITGVVEDVNEYAIGVAVFNRDPATYNTSEDPIVRIQVGRLRKKLKQYYATFGAGVNIEISVPLGSYLPVAQPYRHCEERPPPKFAIHPFRCISHDASGDSFVQGLYDELVHQFFKKFGEIVLSHSSSTFEASGKERRGALNSDSRVGINKWLEGSVQIEGTYIKVSLRLIDVLAGTIIWTEQFNLNAALSILSQEEIALSICRCIEAFFDRE